MSRRLRSLAGTIRSRDSGNGYVAYHAVRYAVLLETLVRHDPAPTRALDIGSSLLTELIHERFGIPVDTLGFQADGPNTTAGRHYRFDLNDTDRHDQRRADLPTYPLVVMAEVIEHLYTSPTHVLSFLHEHVATGGILVIQTPNAVALSNRVKLAFGRNPFHLIDEDRANPLHFREYTQRELHRYASAAGFEVLESRISSYFDERYAWHAGRNKAPWFGAVQNRVYRALPRDLRSGITLVLRRNA